MGSQGKGRISGREDSFGSLCCSPHTGLCFSHHRVPRPPRLSPLQGHAKGGGGGAGGGAQTDRKEKSEVEELRVNKLSECHEAEQAGEQQGEKDLVQESRDRWRWW